MTRTWFSMPDGEQFHCAGIWRESAEWGNVYSMVMTEAAGVVERIHNRMPVILDDKNVFNYFTDSAEENYEKLKPTRSEMKMEVPESKPVVIQGKLDF